MRFRSPRSKTSRKGGTPVDPPDQPSAPPDAGPDAAAPGEPASDGTRSEPFHSDTRAASAPETTPVSAAESAAPLPEELREIVADARQRFISSFHGRFEVLGVLIDSAASGDAEAFTDLRYTAHRLVGRAGATQFPLVAKHASTIEMLALADNVAGFDAAAARAALGELWAAFAEERTQVLPGAVDVRSEAQPDVRQTILIADDDEDQQFLLARILRRSAYNVEVVSTGADVLDAAARCRPAAILLDVQMPDQDGFTTARQLKARPETATIPLVFLTGRGAVDDRLLGLQAGADDYLSKSVDPRELVLRVQRLCERALPPPPGPATDERPVEPWLVREDFEAQVRKLLARSWGALALIRGPHGDERVGQWLAEQLRRRDLIGHFGGGRWALFLPEETASAVRPRLADLVQRLSEVCGGAPAAGLAGCTHPGVKLEQLEDEADQALARAQAARTAVVDHAQQEGAAGVGTRAVLLIDDDPEVTRITDAHVRATGYRTMLAFDGEQAVQAIRTQRPDAVVLDLMLPKRTGFDVLAEIRQMPAPRPRAVVLSARGREEDITRAFSLGADDYMIKPFSPQELMMRLERLLR